MSARRLSTFRFPRIVALCSVIMITFSITSTYSTDKAQTSSNACVRLFQQTTEGINLQITTLDTRDGHATTTTEPTIPPQSLLSPDGKYAAFWQIMPDNQDGLYIGSTINGKPMLLYETSAEKARLLLHIYYPVSFAWSPDSSTFAFVDDNHNQITLISSDGKTKNSLPIDPPKGQEKVGHVAFFGWAADSKYLAAEVEPPENHLPISGDLRVWSAASQSPVATGLVMAPSE